MSSESPPASPALTRDSPQPPSPSDPPAFLSTATLLDGASVVAFLALTFLLGLFPLKDTDFWWHLRTGDLIRQTKQVPQTDLYTFTAADHRWTDLHWGFQVALSWGYEHGGVVALNLAKCVVTVLAVLLLLSARRRDWPIWPALLAWLPALLVLSGRMYVRPETLSLLYLSAFLAILFRWEERPALAFLLPLIQVAWVNTQGLFVFGPVVLVWALIQAALRPGAFSPARKRWWRIAGIVTLLVAIACFVNPYGLRGAFYPLQLAGTMGNPIFTNSIAELMPIPLFIQRNAGWRSVPLLLHVATMLIGALSFLVPLVWSIGVRFRDGAGADTKSTQPLAALPAAKGKGRKKASKKRADRAPAPAASPPTTGWTLSLFRLFLFAAFSLLSWRATRNSHQFAAVVGTVTAWNFAEWAAALRARRAKNAETPPRKPLAPRIATLATIVVVFALVATGQFYALCAEGRTIGLGEEPLWYPHEATRFAGQPGMPDRFLSFHDGYAALYEYYHGPERKVFADARLEVVGPELYERYLNLRRRIEENQPGWERELDDLNRPAILVGHPDNAVTGASLMANSHYRCVWFDDLAAVFVHDAFASIVSAHQVDFAARHFHSDSARDPKGSAALLASARALWKYANALQYAQRAELARPLVLVGMDHARKLKTSDPNTADAWKMLGLLELSRDAPLESTSPRFRLPFDPVIDLSTVRATYALRRALAHTPSDFLTLLLLVRGFELRGMHETALPLLEQIMELHPINREQATMQASQAAEVARLRQQIGPEPPSHWENLSELDRIVSNLLTQGRAASAADLLERAYPPESRPWDVSDRIATLWLHLGEPERARTTWQKAVNPPDPAKRSARVAVTHLVEDDLDLARHAFLDALSADPTSFEASYGLAVLEQDAGRAREAQVAARDAAAHAPGEVARSAARLIQSESSPYAAH